MHFLNPHLTSLNGFAAIPPIATYITDVPQHKTEHADAFNRSPSSAGHLLK